MLGLLPLAAAALLAAATPPTPAKRQAALAERGLARAAASGALTPDEAARYGADLRAALALRRRLPPERARNVAAVLGDVAALWRSYSRPRALALFSTLEENVRYLANHRLPAAGTDITGADGVLYRFFPGHGFVFHPLGNFALLNAEVSAGDDDGAAQLAGALVERAVPVERALRWEYYFPFGRGRPPWVSGMAQAVAAQALARAGDRLSDPALLGAADSAYRSVPGRLVVGLPAGPWIKLYSFDRVAVLNAQLQATISIADYAEISGDAGAAGLAAVLARSAASVLPRFDTGFWSLYSLRGDESPLEYHDYVISLLRKLAVRTGDSLWRETAERFEAYESQPPIVHPGALPPTLYPHPEDGYRDSARFGFWLSKRSRVTLRVGGHVQTAVLGHGYRAIEWAPGESPPGLYHPRLTVVDLSGHRVGVPLSPILVRYDRRAPTVDVTVTPPSTVSWEAVDEGTPWVELTVRLDRGREHRVVQLGRRGHRGTARLKLPPGRWHATLLAANSAGRIRSVSLGFLPR